MRLLRSTDDMADDQALPGRSVVDVEGDHAMIRKIKSGEYRLYSRKVDPTTGKRKNLGTFGTRETAKKHERAIQFFKHQG